MTAAVFVDSSVWIDHLRGGVTPETLALGQLLDRLDPDSGDAEPAQVLVGDLVLLEVLRGIADEWQYNAPRAALHAFPQARIGGTEVALAAADHYRSLRRRGITVRKAVDCLIAAWCIAHDVPLLHADRDYAPFVAHCGFSCMAKRRKRAKADGRGLPAAADGAVPAMLHRMSAANAARARHSTARRELQIQCSFGSRSRMRYKEADRSPPHIVCYTG